LTLPLGERGALRRTQARLLHTKGDIPMHITKPTLIDREPQPYVAISASVPIQQLGEKLPPLIGEVFAWLDARNVAPAGAPFWKYNLVDMDRELEVEVGVPVRENVAGDDRVYSALLPGGRYASLTHVGHPSELMDATAALLKWAADRDVTWDVSDTPEGQRWVARLEIFETDPDQEPDMSKWQTTLAFRIAQ